jgi:EAL domain-containing protein (putative c-di-GMP-specific phosphodiesterase class I)
MSLQMIERVELEARLRRAIINEDLLLMYQPKYELVTGKLVGVEALVRWQDPEQGLIAPSDFIPLAEDTGLIKPMGEWILNEACRTHKAWQKAGLKVVPVAVNLSGIQFADENLINIIIRILKETEMHSHYLELEITESAVVQDAEGAIIKLNLLRDMGVELSIDDFGTGYSSMTYLKQFPISSLKIDRSFIADLPDNRDSKSIVNAVIVLAHGLGMRVIAEGIETIEQLDYLREQGCDIGQGYYLGRPMDKEKIEELLSN